MNEAITTEDSDKIREALERLKNSSMEIGKAIYSQTSDDSSAQPEEEPKQEPEAETKEEDKEKKDEEKK